MALKITSQKEFICLVFGLFACIGFVLIYQLFQELQQQQDQLQQIRQAHYDHVAVHHGHLSKQMQNLTEGLNKFHPLHGELQRFRAELERLKHGQGENQFTMQQHAQALDAKVKYFEEEISKIHTFHQQHVQELNNRIQHFDDKVAKIQQHTSRQAPAPHPAKQQPQKQKEPISISPEMPIRTLPSWHIFQIGFHKCGTNTLHNFFMLNHIPSVHNQDYNGHRQGVTLLHQLMAAHEQQQPILSHLGDKYTAFGDFGTHTSDGMPWYQIISQQYPDSKYILNIRPVYAWLRSRYTHLSPDNQFMIDKVKRTRFPNYGKWNLSEPQMMRLEAKVLRHWKIEWYQYLCGALDFFFHQHPELRENMMVFDVERDDFEKLVTFLGSFGLSSQSKGFTYQGETNLDKLPPLQANLTRLQMEKWEVLTQRYAELAGDVDADYMFNTEYERIAYHCNQLNISVELEGIHANSVTAHTPNRNESLLNKRQATDKTGSRRKSDQ